MDLQTQNTSLQRLQNVERRVVRVLDIAGGVMEELASPSGPRKDFVNSHCREFMQSIKDIQVTLREEIKSACEYRPFEKCDYNARIANEICFQKLEYVLSQLHHLKNTFDRQSLAIWRNLKTRVLQVGDEKKRNKDLSLRRETKRERERIRIYPEFFPFRVGSHHMGSKRMRLQTSPMSEMDATDEMHEALFAKRGCCFLVPCLASSQPSRSVWWRRIRTTGDKLEPGERRWIRGWRKTRQWSELVAGPRWKTFIRRFGRNHCCGGCAGNSDCVAISPNRSEQGKFRYDPLSYSLNFDDGKQTGHFEDEFPYQYYSKRFAAPSLPVSTKCPMDFDSDREAQSLHK